MGSEESIHVPVILKYGPMYDQVIIQISCGEQHSLALSSTGQIFSWGRNYYGRLGHGDSNNRPVPTQIRALYSVDVRWVSAGVAYSCCVCREGKVYTWGNGGHGQLGHNSTQNVSLPTLVNGLSNEIVTRISAAYGHTLCVTAGGEGEK